MSPRNHAKSREASDSLTYSIPEAAALLGVSRNLLYRLAAQGVIRTIALGRRRLIPRSFVDRLLSEGNDGGWRIA